MKSIRRMTALTMAVLIVVILLGASALAAGTQSSDISTLKPGKWYSTVSGSNLLSVKVSKDSLLTANWKGNSQERLSINLYKDANRKNYLTDLYTYQTASGTQSFVLRKGTYYVSFYDSTKNSKVKFNVSALKDYKNYCPSRAVTMKKGVKYLHGAHVPLNSFEYDWFKIKLTKKQRITMYCSTNSNYVTFRDKNMKAVDNESYTKKAYRTVNVLNPGTYYVRINNYGVYNTYANRASTIWWE